MSSHPHQYDDDDEDDREEVYPSRHRPSAARSILSAVCTLTLLAMNALPVVILTDVFYGAINNPLNILARGDPTRQVIVKILLTLFMSIPIFLQAFRSDYKAMTQVVLGRRYARSEYNGWFATVFVSFFRWTFYLGVLSLLGALAWSFARRSEKAEIAARWFFDTWLFPITEFVQNLF